MVRFRQKNYQEAINLLKRTLAFYENEYGRNHIKSSQASIYLSQVYLSLGDLDKSEEILLQILPILDRYNHFNLKYCIEFLVETYQKKSEILTKSGQKNLADIYYQKSEDLKKGKIIKL